MKNGLVLVVHRLAGLLSGLFILIMSFSGAILVFHEEFERLQYPTIAMEGNKGLVSIDSCYQVLQNTYPHAEISNVQVAQTVSEPFVFTLYDSSYKQGTAAWKLFLHPQSASIIQSEGANENILSWMASLHNSFHLGKKGEWLLGFFGLVFILSILTGILLFRKNIVATLAFRKRIFKRANLHQLIGTWALLFNLMIAITGVWMQRYVFKKDFYMSYDYTPVLQPSPGLFYSVDSALKGVKEKYSGFTAHVIYFAQSKKGKFAVYGSQATNSFIHSKKFADVIFLDSTGGIAKTAFVSEISFSARYDIINSQVHFGGYGGWTVKIIYCLFGLSGGLLSITGFLLWLKRKRIRQ